MIRRGNIYILCILLNQLLVMSVIMVFRPQISDSPYSMAGFMIITQLFCFVPPLLIYGIAVKPKSLLSFKPIGIMNTVFVFFMCLAIQPVMLVLSALSMIFFENPVGDMLSSLSQVPLPVTLFVMAVMPAVLEEITMRGVVLKNYEGLPIKKAAIINGVLFGILHLNPQQFLYAMLLGIVFAYYAYYTESLWAPILGHFIINATQIIIGTASARMIEAMPAETQKVMESPAVSDFVSAGIFLIVLNIIFIPVFIILFRSFIDYNKRRRVVSAMESPEPTIETPPAQTSAQVFDWAFIAIILFYVLYLGVF